MSRLDRTAEDREVLRKAGMSEASELTRDEIRNMPAARRALRDNPRIARDRIYRIIRPYRPDEFDV